MSPEPQTYANHKRIDPWYHYVGFALALLALVLAVVNLFRGHGGAWQLVVSVLLVLMFLKLRLYALRVQDRVIRLEEILRMRALLPPDHQESIQQLTPAQLVALRFAADAELAVRVAEALKEGLDREQIKQRIQTWRPDTFRV
jgi:hypothetical protein